jgi:amino acid transporter
MVTATFAYLGTELVGVTVGEAQNPRKTIPRAIKLTFYRIVFFYCISILFLGMCVPYDAPRLVFATDSTRNPNTSNASASPFVVAITMANIPALDHILNACILVFVFSAANSDLYIASRTLYGLASDGSAPNIFRKTDSRGVPLYALGLSTCFGCLAYLNCADDSRTVFVYFVDLVTIFGLLTWVSILVTHIWFVKARKAQNLQNSALPYVAPLGIYGSYGALFMCILISLTKSFQVFIGPFNYRTFITSYLGIPIYLVLIFGHKFWTKSKGIRPHECDFYTGKDIIDREEEAFVAAKEAEKATRGSNAGGAFYKRWVSWLF